jgi:hypothetical protein
MTIILPERGAPRGKLLLPMRPQEWRAPSQRRTTFGIEDQTRWRLTARYHDGYIAWRGFFDDRNDADAFMFAAVAGSLQYERQLWDLPVETWTPQSGYGREGWRPGIAEGLIYDFATITFITAPTGTTTGTVPGTSTPPTRSSLWPLAAAAAAITIPRGAVVAAGPVAMPLHRTSCLRRALRLLTRSASPAPQAQREALVSTAAQVATLGTAAPRLAPHRVAQRVVPAARAQLAPPMPAVPAVLQSAVRERKRRAAPAEPAARQAPAAAVAAAPAAPAAMAAMAVEAQRQTMAAVVAAVQVAAVPERTAWLVPLVRPRSAAQVAITRPVPVLEQPTPPERSAAVAAAEVKTVCPEQAVRARTGTRATVPVAAAGPAADRPALFTPALPVEATAPVAVAVVVARAVAPTAASELRA